MVYPAPPTPFKFLDIGTKMGLYEVEGLTLCPDEFSVHHPRSTDKVLAPNTFHEAVHKAWQDPSRRFSVVRLPFLTPTCRRKLFEEGPRHKYVDIVTDTLHTSSSDLITLEHSCYDQN